MSEEELAVGKKIKSLRTAKNMPAKQLANEAGISFGMLSQLEKGSTQGSVETLRKIAKVLDVTLAHLFTNSEENIISTNLENFDVNIDDLAILCKSRIG
ncbi:MAG: helix-turn-helix transcriptional regulator [Sulfurimonas sp.]